MNQNSNPLKALSQAGDDLVLGNYIVLFGGNDLSGERFSKSTVFDSDYTDIGTLYVDFEHGLDPDNFGIDQDNILGIVNWRTAKADDKGIFVERVLSRRSRYVKYLVELVEAGMVGTSSEAVRGQIAKTKDGEITHWPLKRDSLTLTPMEPRMLTSNVLSAAKSLAGFFPSSPKLATLAGLPVPDEPKAIQDIETLRDAEAYLRDVGRFSRAQAAAFTGRLKSLIAMRDAGSSELAELAQALKAREQHIPR